MSFFYKIKDKNKKLIFFKRNKLQRDFKKRHTNRNIILKSRQLGFTTDECIDSLDDVLFEQNFDALIIAHEKEEALKIFDNKVNLAWINFNEELKNAYAVEADRANTLKFGHGEGIYSSISVASSGRSQTYHRVHISEFPKICAKYPKKAEEIISGTIPAVPLEGRVDIEGTAEGEIGEFHDMFWDAWNRQGGKNFDPAIMRKQPMEYAAFFYNWQWDEEEINQIREPLEVPAEFLEYQQKHDLSEIEITYYYQKFLALGKNWSRLKQQYPTTPTEAFRSSGERLFDSDKVLACEKEYPSREKVGDWIWLAEFDNRHRYALGADVAEGVGRDSCAASIWDFDENEIVAIYFSNKIDPVNFAYELRTGGNRYGTCLIGPEANNHGHATISKLKEIYSIEQIYTQIIENKIRKTKTQKLGWHTNLATKPKMMFDFNDAINQNLIKIPREIAHEARLYGKDKLNELKADPDATLHFDLLTSAVIGWQMRNVAETSGSQSNLLEKMQQSAKKETRLAA
jgi:hypothetical protein